MSWESALAIMFPGGFITHDGRGGRYDWQAHWNRPGRQRYSASNGVDISATPIKGSPVYSPIEGTVISTSPRVGIVSVRDKDGNIHRFLHLAKFDVTPNTHVKVGTRVGIEGKRGTKAVHLHYDINIGGRGYYEDPVKWWNGDVDPGERDPSPKETSKEEDAEEMIASSGGATPSDVNSKTQNPRANATVNNINDSPKYPANVGTSSEYAPRKAPRSQGSNAMSALWTNRVPDHEPWPRVMMDNETTNAPSAGPSSNVRHYPQYSDDKTAETSGKIGRIDGMEEYERNKFWRR